MANVVDLTQQPIGSVLPFLRQLISNPGPDFSGMTSDNEADAPAPVPPLQVPNQAPPQPSPGAVDFSQPLPPADLSQAPQGAPKLAGPTKAHQLLNILQKGITGALMGQAQNAQTYAATGRNAGFGGGFYGSMALPLELQHQQLANQQVAQTLPFLRASQIAGIQKTQAEAGKFGADAAKATAEAGAIPTKTALEKAQTDAAVWKEEPATGQLRNIQTGETLGGSNGEGTAILDAPSAAVLGKQAGDRVPIKVATQAKALADAGVSYTTANGHNWLVDKQGNKLKDMGVATPIVLNNIQNAIPKGENGQPSSIAQSIAKGDMAWKDVVSPRTPMSVKEALLKEVKSVNPNYNSGDFEVEKRVREKFTSGNVSDQLMAINTAREHMKTFSRLADALDNSDWQLANKIGNEFGVQFGDDRATNLRIAQEAFSGEVGKAFAGAGVTAGEREKAGQSLSDYLSKGQFHGAIQTVDELLAGKQRSAKQSYDSGRAGNPNFGSQPTQQTPNKHSDIGFVKD